MAQLGNTIINGILRVNGAITASSIKDSTIQNSTWIGKLVVDSDDVNQITVDSTGDNSGIYLYRHNADTNVSWRINNYQGILDIERKKVTDSSFVKSISIDSEGNNLIKTHLYLDGIVDASPSNKSKIIFGTTSAKSVIISATNAGVLTFGKSDTSATDNLNINVTNKALYPNTTENWTLGNTDKKFSNVYSKTFTGALSGNATSATSATKATQDSDGNAINTTYLKKSGGTMTGAITLKGLVAQSLLDTTADFDTLADGIYHTATDGSTKNNISHAPVARSQMFITATAYSSGTDIRKAQLSLDCDGIMYVRNYRDANKPWYTVLTTNNHSSYSLPLAGGTMNETAQIQRKGGTASSWYNGRDNALIRYNSYTGYNPLLSMKTTDGSWELGAYSDNKLHLSYITDANYTAKTNTQTRDFVFNVASNTITASIDGNAATATKATNDSDNNAINTTYLKKSGGTMTGNLNLKGNLIINDGVNNQTIIRAYDDGDAQNYGCEVVMTGNGNTFVGAGESVTNLRTTLAAGTATGETYSATGEHLYIASDQNMYFYSKSNTIGDRLGIVYDTSGALRPLVNNTRTLGTSSIKWNNVYSTTFTSSIGTVASSADASATNIQAMSSTDFESKKASMPNGTLVAVW